MNTKTDPDLDAMIHAFVDGELDAQAEQAARAQMETDPAAAQRAHDYRRQGDALHDLYDDVLSEPLAAEMRAALNAPVGRSSRSFWNAPVWRMAAAIALFVAGGFGGWWSHAVTGPDTSMALAQSSPYVSRAIGAHVVYAAEVRHPVEVAASEEQHLIKWLSARLGRDVHAPKLAEAGFELVGGRLLPDDAKPAAQFMYENRTGQRVTLYVSLNGAPADTSFRIVEQDGTSAIYWLEDGLGYALAGDLPREDMLKIARLVYDALIA